MSIWIRKRQAEKRERRMMKERSARRSRPALEALSLPDDLTGNGVRVILLNGTCALVENCLAVAGIGDEQIRLRTRTGTLVFQGRGLSLQDVRKGALTVTGQIASVFLPLGFGEGAGSDA